MYSSEISSHDQEEISSIFSLELTKDAHPRPRLTIIAFPFEDHTFRSHDTKCKRVMCRFLEILVLKELLHRDICLFSWCDTYPRDTIVRLPIDDHITEALLGRTKDESIIHDERKLVSGKHTPNLSWILWIARVSEIKWKNGGKRIEFRK